MMKPGNILQRSHHKLAVLRLQMSHRSRGFLHMGDCMRSAGRRPSIAPKFTELTSIERARQIEVRGAESLLDAFRAGAIRR